MKKIINLMFFILVLTFFTCKKEDNNGEKIKITFIKEFTKIGNKIPYIFNVVAGEDGDLNASRTFRFKIFWGDDSSEWATGSFIEGRRCSFRRSYINQGEYFLYALSVFENTGETLYSDTLNITVIPTWVEVVSGDECVDVCLTGNGEYIAVGTIYGLYANEVYVIKFNGDGEVIWEKTYYESGFNNWCNGYAIAPTSDLGCIIGGKMGNYALMKINSSGDIEWLKSYNFPAVCYSIRKLEDGDYIVVGSTYNDTTGVDALIFKIKPDGDLIWKTSFGGFSQDIIRSVCLSNDGYIVVGYKNSTELLAAKIGFEGQILWEKTYGEGMMDGKDICRTKDGYFIIVGDYGILKIDDNGGLIWKKDYILNCICLADDNNFITAGYNKVLKVDNDGNIIWETHPGNRRKIQRILPYFDGGFIGVGIFEGWGEILKMDPQGESQY